jgi:phage baseplate assembly protein V
MNEFVFSEVARRLNNIVRFGTVAEIDLKKARVRIKIGKITTDWLPWLTLAGAVKIWNPPVVGEQVCVVSQGGDLSLAVAIPSIF